MKDVLTDIQDGTFARNWIADYKQGGKEFRRMESENLGHIIEGVGKDLRAQMSWINKSENDKA